MEHRTAIEHVWDLVTGDSFLAGALATWGAMWLLFSRLNALAPGGWPWRLALAWVVLSLTIRLVDGSERAWALWRRPESLPPYHPFSNSERTTLATSDSLGSTSDHVLERLLQHFSRVRRSGRQDGAAFYADRSWKGVIGCPLMCLGTLVIVLGSVIGARFDVDPTAIELTPAQSARVQGLPMTVALDNLSGNLSADGVLSGAVATVHVKANGSERGRYLLKAGHPAFLGLDWVHLAGGGAAIAIGAIGADGKPMPIQVPATSKTSERAVVFFHSPQEEHDLVLPDAQIALRLVLSSPRGPIGKEGFLVQAFRPTAQTPMLSEYVSEETDVKVGRVKLHLTPTAFAHIQASRRVSLWVYMLGALLLLAGTVWQSVFYPHRVWVRVRTRRGGVAMDIAVERSPFVAHPLEDAVDSLTGEEA